MEGTVGVDGKYPRLAKVAEQGTKEDWQKLQVKLGMVIAKRCSKLTKVAGRGEPGAI